MKTLSNMKTVIIENRLHLVAPNTFIKISINVPRLNIQKMLTQTGARLLSKNTVALNYNHNAGIVYRCEISVRFANIEKYLNSAHYSEAENAKQYHEFIKINQFHPGGMAYNVAHCLTIKTGLYAFGECYTHFNGNPSTTTYYFKTGRIRSIRDSVFTEFGKKRYIKHMGRLASNRKF